MTFYIARLHLTGGVFTLPARAFVARVLAELLNRSGETGLDFLRGEFTVDVVIFFRGVLARRKEHGAPHREVNERHERSHADDSHAQVLDAFVGLDAFLGEEERRRDRRASVTTGTDEARDDTEGTTGDEGDDAVGGAFRRLDENGEENHEGDGDAEVVLGETHEDAKDAFNGLADPQGPEATAHTEAGGSPIGNDTTDGAGEEVHETVAGRQDAGGLQRDAELIKEVTGDNVVHRELDAEAHAVGENHDPHAVVHHTNLVDEEGVLLFERARGGEHLVVAIRQILAEEHHGETDEDVAQAREDVRPTPGGERVLLGGRVADGVDARHEELRDTATEVTPTRGGGVGETDALVVEHARHPELARDKRREAETDAETADEEAFKASHQGHGKAKRRRGEKNDRETETRADDVAHRTHDDPTNNRTRHRRETGVSELRLGQPKIFANHRNHRRRGKRGDKRDEETQPRHVEGKVVRSRKVQRVELHRLVFAARVQKNVSTRRRSPRRARPSFPSVYSSSPSFPVYPVHRVRFIHRARSVRRAICIQPSDTRNDTVSYTRPTIHHRSRRAYLSTGMLKLCCVVGAMMRVVRYRSIQSNNTLRCRRRRRRCVVCGTRARVDKCRTND